MNQTASPTQHEANVYAREQANRFEGQAKRQARRVIRKIVSTALVLVIGKWVFIGWSLWSEDSAARTVARVEGFNLTAALAQELTASLDSAAARLDTIARTFRAMPAAAVAGPAEMRQALIGIVGPDIHVHIAGPDGQSIIPGADGDPGSAEASRPPHVLIHPDNRASGLSIDAYDGQSGESSLVLSRRLETADGQFAGEARLLLTPGSMITINRQIDIGPRGMIAITDTNGIVRAGFDSTHPDGLLGIGTDLRGDAYPEHLEPGGTAFYIRHGRLVPIQRMIAMRRLVRYGLNVHVALDLNEVLGSARLHMVLIGLAGFGGTVLMTALTLLLTREVWRRTGREIELACDRDALHLAQVRIEADRAQLAETNRALLIAKEAAEAASHARAQFLAHMSHELRTPLHAIIGFSELIQDQAPPRPGSPPIAGYAADIRSSGRHLLEMINDLLDISKVESGSIKLMETAFPVADFGRNIMTGIQAQADARNITIDMRLPDVVWRIRADRARLLQVLNNLLSNAIKFSPEYSRVILSVSESEDGEPVFSVIDEGIGMTEQEMQIAQEPFRQAESNLSRSFDGTGLGLPLARKLTELHGGRLELKSVKGQGTTAIVILPPERLAYRSTVSAGGMIAKG